VHSMHSIHGHSASSSPFCASSRGRDVSRLLQR
jgi:hypothetical protein